MANVPLKPDNGIVYQMMAVLSPAEANDMISRMREVAQTMELECPAQKQCYDSLMQNIRFLQMVVTKLNKR